MNRTTIFLSALLFISLNSCVKKQNKIDENIQKVLMEFVEKHDFAGYIKFEDGLYAINTCLSATLYDIDTNHYLTLIICRYAGDPLKGTPYDNINSGSTMYYDVGGKDMFVYNHTLNSTTNLFPQNLYSKKDIREKEKKYVFDEKTIDDRVEVQTYRYRLEGGDIWIEKDSTFDFFKWLYDNI